MESMVQTKEGDLLEDRIPITPSDSLEMWQIQFQTPRKSCLPLANALFQSPASFAFLLFMESL